MPEKKKEPFWLGYVVHGYNDRTLLTDTEELPLPWQYVSVSSAIDLPQLLLTSQRILLIKRNSE